MEIGFPVKRWSHLHEILYRLALSLPIQANCCIISAPGCITACFCQSALFYSDNKYDSGCGWPSFDRPVSKGAIRYLEDFSHSIHRIEIRCGKCDAHLGHVFPDGPQTTGERYCVNSASLSFIDGSDGEKVDG